MPLPQSYSLSLVILSVLIASAASYTALTLAGRVTQARGSDRIAWLAGGSLAMGLGIWSMHFVGMLALHLPVPIAYRLQTVLLSILPAVAASTLALLLASRPRVGLVALALGALSMGPAIAGMHYIGMAALNVPATLHWDYGIVVASVAVAVAASFAGLGLAYRLRADDGARIIAQRAAAAVIMGVAIAGMHYTGMAAVHFTTPGRTGAGTGGLLATGDLAVGVGVGALVILALSLLGSAADLWVRRRDETSERRQQSQRLEAIGQLAGGIAHDFNNLLTAILGNVAFVLEATPKTDPRYEDVLEIERAATRAAELTRQLLAFGRKQILRPTTLDLNAVLAYILRMLNRLVGEHIEIALRPAPALGLVLADMAQLEQVIVNLVVNARDAMPDGGKLIIETRNVALDQHFTKQHGVAAGPYVLMAFTDTGVGMDPATQARIFEPFFTTKPRGQGTGLGLATVYGIIKQSGGTVSVYSEPNRGSTFKLYLPQVSEAAREGGEAPAPFAATVGSGTVLLVEDEEIVRSLAARVLKASGYRVLVAGNPAEAERASAEHAGPIDLLLTDVIMPGTTGPKLAAELAAARPGMRVLYMSGFTENAIVHHGVLAPETQFIHKPFTPASLAAKVGEVLMRTEGAPAADH
jgi:NO-binding membrane sensor protein with MHYT domain/nitrogen-specific signal transduction histidine kinase/CheY-like chemotaxis protein